MRNYMHSNSNPTHNLHSIKHKVSPLHEQLLVQDQHGGVDTNQHMAAASAQNRNGKGTGLRTTVRGSPRNPADMQVEGPLESKLSETIPVRPEHKDLLSKKSKVNLKSFVDKLDRKGINLSVRGGL